MSHKEATIFSFNRWAGLPGIVIFAAKLPFFRFS